MSGIDCLNMHLFCDIALIMQYYCEKGVMFEHGV